MEKPRVVITGMGVVCPVGPDLDRTWRALLAGKSGVRRVSLFDASRFPVQIGGEAHGFDAAALLGERDARHTDRFCQLGLVACEEALRDSGLALPSCDLDRFGVIVGSGIGGLGTIEEQGQRLHELGPGRVGGFAIPKLMSNALAGQIAMRYGLHGPSFSIASACSSSNHAIGAAMKAIRHGEADVVATGGAEAALTPLGLAGFASLRAISSRNDEPERASRPFDRDRNGFVLGEGAGILVLESLDHAVARGARIYAEVIGFGMSSDAHHPTAPDETGCGAARAISLALRDAGVSPEQVDYVNAHGTSTRLNDRVESIALRRVFGGRISQVAVNSTKSMIGHLLGAAAAVEAIVTALSLRDDVVHPTLNYESPDPECELDVVAGEARPMPVRVAISNSLGFGGHNSTLVLAKRCA